MVQTNKQKLRELKRCLIEQIPRIEPYLVDILPKDSAVFIATCTEPRVQFAVVNKQVLFFAEGNKISGPWMPSLRLLHQYPFLLPKVQVDLGAIPFVMKGANVACPGLTSTGGKLDEDFVEGTVVAIMAQDKEHCLGIGLALMSRDEVRSQNEGHAFRNLTTLNDGLWNLVFD